jgi:hypothetical protein
MAKGGLTTLLKASRVLEKLIQQAISLRLTLSRTQEQEEALNQLEADLRKLQRILNKRISKELVEKKPTEVCRLLGKFLFKVIEYITEILKPSLFCKLIRFYGSYI